LGEEQAIFGRVVTRFSKNQFDGAQFRHDIAAKALGRNGILITRFWKYFNEETNNFNVVAAWHFARHNG
jgi:ribosomal protein L11